MSNSCEDGAIVQVVKKVPYLVGSLVFAQFATSTK